MPPPNRSRPDAGRSEEGEDEEGTGGRGTGGRGGTGGKTGGTGGSKPAPLDAAPPADANPPSPDAAAPKRDASRDFAAIPAASFEKLELVLANCVYCHNDDTKRLDLQYTGLHTKLVHAIADKAPANCPTRVVVIPGDPMNSLLYLKVAGTMAASCGARMPLNKPAVTPAELKTVHDWILAGAPEK